MATGAADRSDLCCLKAVTMNPSPAKDDGAASVYSQASTIGQPMPRLTAPGTPTKMGGKKQSLPSNLNTLVSGALEVADAEGAGSSQLRKIRYLLYLFNKVFNSLHCP